MLRLGEKAERQRVISNLFDDPQNRSMLEVAERGKGEMSPTPDPESEPILLGDAAINPMEIEYA
jgi:hypothetical protein